MGHLQLQDQPWTAASQVLAWLVERLPVTWSARQVFFGASHRPSHDASAERVLKSAIKIQNANPLRRCKVATPGEVRLETG